ncbi:hypothetical protein [Desulfovibrio sp.]|uniref:hypothetical protein n=1 Tax=Desulfovibrio sp. TaxID=885 RepID=UPI002590D097|nr:hypothetical protein [Desulfovibrio sp.]
MKKKNACLRPPLGRKSIRQARRRVIKEHGQDDHAMTDDYRLQPRYPCEPAFFCGGQDFDNIPVKIF